VIWHTLDTQTLESECATNVHTGLGVEEAAARLEADGPNALPVGTSRSAVMRFVDQFRSPLIYVLLVAAAVTLALADYVDAAVIGAVVLVNALIGFIQEGRAERALESVRGLLAEKATVVRSGSRQVIDASELVRGDLIVLESGSRVPADARVVSQRGVSVSEATLTGESVPVAKTHDVLPEQMPLAERSNMLYTGTVVNSGLAHAIVVDTGSRTELGRIGSLVDQVGALTTPLTNRLSRFAHHITLAIIGVGGFAFAWGVLVHQLDLFDLFLAVVGIAVAAIPEGLPAIVTIVLAIGTRLMAERGALIRRLPAVETLGSVSLIWTDKTGTLTTNEMTVVDVVTDAGAIEVTGVGYEPAGELRVNGQPIVLADWASGVEAIEGGVLCNRAELRGQEGDAARFVGDPLDAALLVLAEKAGVEPSGVTARYPLIDTVPFESERRFMATQHDDSAHSGTRTWVKGAPERVIELAQDAGVSQSDAELWGTRSQELASRGRRVIALATSAEPPQGDSRFPGLRIVALVGVIDPPRQEAKAAISACYHAGIAVKMITGDHVVTASVIAGQLGLRGERPLVGSEIDFLDDDELIDRIGETDVIARASPQHKLRLVTLSQAAGHQVAMTGDGVNDAPALQAADIGVAMGKNGTDAARQASDLVLTDDRFETIQAAVFRGRVVFDNIKKALLFILPTNLGEAGVILFALMLGATLPITATQILWVNMVTAVTLALALVWEPGEPGVMVRAPRPRAEALLTGRLLTRLVFVGGLMVASTTLVFQWQLDVEASVEQARTAAVSMLVVGELFYLFNVRWFTRHSLTHNVFRGNIMMWLTPAALLAFQALFVYSPWMNDIFGTSGLELETWLVIVGIAVVQFLLVEAEKTLLRSRGVDRF